MKDLNIRPKAMKLLEEHIGSKFLDKGLGDDFLKIWKQKQKQQKQK